MKCVKFSFSTNATASAAAGTDFEISPSVLTASAVGDIIAKTYT